MKFLLFNSIILYFVINSECVLLILERAEMTSKEEYLESNLTCSKINRTNFALSGYGNLKIDLDDDGILLHLQLYGFFSNEYRELPVTITRKICDIFKFEYQMVKSEIDKVGNFPDRCPVKAGFYYVKNYIPDIKKMTFFKRTMPWKTRKYLAQGTVTFDNVVYAVVKIYVTLNDDDRFLVE